MKLQKSLHNPKYNTSNKVIFLLGPTGIGKSKFALEIAKLIPIEIINADSKQIYKFMNIGTSKPNNQDLKIVKHHLINLINPNEEFSLQEFLNRAKTTINKIADNNKFPVVVGGTNQYITALIEGWNPPVVKANKELRNKYQDLINKNGSEFLFQQLQAIDPETAIKIHPNNHRRLIRALEIIETTGTKISTSIRKVKPEYNFIAIALTTSRPILYSLIDKRVDLMLKNGLEQEVKTLLKKGYLKNNPGMNSIGYGEIIDYLEKKISYEKAIQLIKYRTHKLVRQQYTWLNARKFNISFIDINNNPIKIFEKIFMNFINSKN